MRIHRGCAYVIASAFAAACAGGGRSGDTARTPVTDRGDEEPPAGGAPSPATMAAKSKAVDLFTRLGGKPAIEAVVGAFVKRLAGDARVKFRFANSNIPKLTADLVDFVCAATGGPCTYRGREMGILHASMHVSKEEWDATVEALVGALDELKVPEAEKGELLSAIGPLESVIVDPPKQKPSGAELAKIEKAARDLSRFGEHAEIMGAAFTALRSGQRGYADQLFSMAEVELGTKTLAKLAPLFRTGAPPRITARPVQARHNSAPQPKGAVGGSDEDAPPRKPEKATLAGTVGLSMKDPKDAFGVVMLTPVKGGGKKRTPKQRVVEQRGREFAPRLIAVPVGSTVAFPNFDDIYHNVFSRSKARPFDLGIFKNAQTREIVFDREGIVRVGCNLHANMSTSIIVVKAPHYAVTDGKGRFRFKSLKPGTYTLEAWTERSAHPVTKKIVVAPGENQVTVDAAADAPPGTGEDKFGAPRGTSP
jgi:hemoglobin